jgi:hypothetical protein
MLPSLSTGATDEISHASTTATRTTAGILGRRS